MENRLNLYQLQALTEEDLQRQTTEALEELRSEIDRLFDEHYPEMNTLSNASHILHVLDTEIEHILYKRRHPDVYPTE